MHCSSTQADVHLCLKVWGIWGIIQVSPSTIIHIQHKQGNDALHIYVLVSVINFLLSSNMRLH